MANNSNKIGVVGTGVIGNGWIARFWRRGIM